jgi:tRNA (guanosine-2'-O-)-methyltransferase
MPAFFLFLHMHRHFRESLLQEFEKLVSPNKKVLIDEALRNRSRYLTVVLENIQKPHNASAVLRTVECLGLQEFHMISSVSAASKPYEANPGIVKGAIKWVDVFRHEEGEGTTGNCLASLRERGYALVVTSPHTLGVYPEELPLDKPLALVFGNEQEGVSETALAAADYHLKIPMWGFTESYNLSVSAAICVYTLMQRIRNSSVSWQLSPEEQSGLRLQWYRKLVKRAEIVESELKRLYDQNPD